MTAKLDQFLEPGEQVVWRLPKCREPHNLYREFSILVIFLALLFGAGLIDIGPDPKMASVVPLMVLLLIGFAMGLLEIRSIEAAVTERRVLRVDTSKDEPKCTSIDLVDIASVEVQFQAVHVTKQNGDGVLLGLPEQASKLGRALARATGLAESRLPGKGEEFATNFSALAGAGGVCAGYVLTLQGLAAAELSNLPFPLGLLVAVPLFLGAILGWPAGKLLALIALRLLLSPKDLRTFVRGHALATIPAAKRGKFYWLAWLYSRLFQFASGIPRAPNHQATDRP